MYSNPKQWERIRNKVLVDGRSVRSVAKCEGISRPTIRKMVANSVPPKCGRMESAPIELAPPCAASKLSHAEADRTRWQQWLYELERGNLPDNALVRSLDGLTVHARKLVIAAMASELGFSRNSIAQHTGLSRTTIRKHLDAYRIAGIDGLLERKPRSLKADDAIFIQALFSLLHEPPSLSGYNRTTWRMDDLREALTRKGHHVCEEVIRQAIRKAGFRWKSAKIVLTSTDPEYAEKLDKVRSVLARLRNDERFFSIDEYGPFAIKAKPGRLLAAPGTNPSVPQWQKSKGWLIVTAALELSHNMVTHFYSRAKNTDEMIKMAERLLREYSDVRTLYLSWDAASWHMSKKLISFVNEHNAKENDAPRIELVPLPASAQFLNVIESVFSGMARAIIHNSNYPSVTVASEAIDRYFAERNKQFKQNPQKAGDRIWGLERTGASFDPSNNCKDPAYR